MNAVSLDEKQINEILKAAGRTATAVRTLVGFGDGECAAIEGFPGIIKELRERVDEYDEKIKAAGLRVK